MAERTIPTEIDLRTSFSEEERKIMQFGLDKLAERDFAVSHEMQKEGGGPLYGLTNERIATLQRKWSYEDIPLDRDDLWVLYCGTLELVIDNNNKVQLGDLSADLAQEAINQIHGKILQLRGFDNSAVEALLQGR